MGYNGFKKFYTKVLEDFKKDNPDINVKVVETEDSKAQENVKKILLLRQMFCAAS